MKKILVATDASELSRKALKMALELARKFNSEVEVLNVIDMPELQLYSEMVIDKNSSWQEKIKHVGEQAIEVTLEGIDISDVILNKKIMQGKPANMILQEIDDQNIDLVVMGSHGHGAIKGAIVGSVSQRVLHGSKCSVYIAK